MRRLFKYGAVALISGAIAMFAGAVPAFASTGGTINSGGGNVNLRAGPGTNYAIVGSLPQGAAVSIDCVGTGTAVTGPFGTTTLWDEIGSGHWVTDAFVNTGTSAPIAMPCGHISGEGYSYGSGTINANVLSGCGNSDSGGGSNYGAFTSGPDWWFVNGGDCLNGYTYTYGNGPNPSGRDYAYWDYFPGAYATCDIYVHVANYFYYPDPKPFTNIANYQVYTNHNGSTHLGSYGINQDASRGQGNPPGDVYVGVWQADGSGFLRVRMDDSSYTGGTSQIVAANQVRFYCTSEY